MTRILPDEFSITLARNPDGWWTSQVKEIPSAISQGQSVLAAVTNVLEALSDLLIDDFVGRAE